MQGGVLLGICQRYEATMRRMLFLRLSGLVGLAHSLIGQGPSRTWHQLRSELMFRFARQNRFSTGESRE
jgi:hypothetical protein